MLQEKLIFLELMSHPYEQGEFYSRLPIFFLMQSSQKLFLNFLILLGKNIFPQLQHLISFVGSSNFSRRSISTLISESSTDFNAAVNRILACSTAFSPNNF